MFYYTGKSNKKQSKNTAHGVLRAVLASAFAAGLLAMLLVSFFALLSAGGCAAEKLSSLRTFAGAHTGGYGCGAASLNGADLLERYREITLELRADGTFCVTASPAGENALHAEGEYGFDEAGGILTLGGTILGTSRQPFKKMRVIEEDNVDKVRAMKENFKKMKLTKLNLVI